MTLSVVWRGVGWALSFAVAEASAACRVWAHSLWVEEVLARDLFFV
jgi:hypothetical protein